MYTPEIFDHLFGEDGSTNESNQVVDSDLPQGPTDPTIPSDRFPKVVCLAH